MIETLTFIIIFSIKLLIFPTNQSTDFEVHRNWKAITTSLPIREWYKNNLNIWTLDYPPLFAYMELILGYISKIIDPNLTNINLINYNNTICKFYMRSTVLIGDFFLGYSLKKLCISLKLNKKKSCLLIGSILSFAGLIIVDNIHFQYNSILFSIFFLSINSIINDQLIKGAFFYTISLCMKHIFIYMAPAYFLYYLKYLILQNLKINPSKVLKDTFLIIITILSTIIISFSPFLYICYKDNSIETFINIKNRLFPLQRGLLHSYWAPNFWAIYSFIDKILLFKNKKYNNKEYKKKNISALGATSINNVTKETGFDILPNITFRISNSIVISFIFIYIGKKILFDNRKCDNNIKRCKFILKYCIMSNLIFFNFSYQVHEKAFIIISLMSLIYVIITDFNKESDSISILSFLLVLIGIIAQIPLIHDYTDYCIKIALVFFYIILVKTMIFNENKIHKSFLFNLIIWGYVFISVVLDFNITFKSIYRKDFNKYVKKLYEINEKYPFLSLMLFSVLSSLMTQFCFIIILIFS